MLNDTTFFNPAKLDFKDTIDLEFSYSDLHLNK